MATESGYSNKKAFGRAHHKTLQDLGSSKIGPAVAQMCLYERTIAEQPVVDCTVDPADKNRIVITLASSAVVANTNDVARITTSNYLEGWEYEVLRQVGDKLYLRNVGTYDGADQEFPEIGDGFRVYRWVTATSDAKGAVTVSPDPLSIMKDGVKTTVAIDTITPSNTQPIPVEIYGAGTTINLTAGDINVQLSHSGATPDSVRVGDGTTTMAIEAVTGKALVKDDAAITAIQAVETDVVAMSAKLPATLGKKTGANSMTVTLSSDEVLPLPTGAATEAKQDAGITALNAIKTSVQLIDDTVGIDGNPKPSAFLVIGGVDNVGTAQELKVNTSGELLVNISSSAGGLATETTLVDLRDKFNANFGSNSGAVRTSAQMGNATGQADFNDGASSAQTLRVSANLKHQGNDLSYNSGGKDANTLRVVIATDQPAIPVTASIDTTGLATSTKQDAEALLLGDVAETAPGTDTASSGLNGRLQRIAQRLSTMIARLPAALGSAVSANSLPVVIASDQVLPISATALPLPTGAATESTLSTLNGKVPSNLTVSATRLLVDNSGVTQPISGSVTTSPTVVAGTVSTVQAAVGLTAVRATVSGSAPSTSRRKLMIKPSANNTGKIYFGGSGVSISNGMEIIGPDRLEFEFDAGDYFVISDTAAQVVEIMEKV